LLGEILRFARGFDANAEPVVRDMIAEMLQLLARSNTTIFYQKWTEIKTFGWNTRFPPGGRVPMWVVKLLRTREAWRCHKQLDKLQRALMKVRSLSNSGELSDSDISRMRRTINEVTQNEAAAVPDALDEAAVVPDALNEVEGVADTLNDAEVVADTLNEVEAVADDTLNVVISDITEFSSPIQVGTDSESQLHEVLTETEPPEMVEFPSPIRLVRADDQDAASDMPSI
jgi:ribosomal protein L29